MANDSDPVGGADLGHDRDADADDVIARLRLRARLTRNAEAAGLPPARQSRRVRWRLSARTTVLAGLVGAVGLAAVILTASAGGDLAADGDDGSKAVVFEPLEGAAGGLGESAGAGGLGGVGVGGGESAGEGGLAGAARGQSAADGSGQNSSESAGLGQAGSEQAGSEPGTASPSSDLVLHVAGAVRAPGIVSVPAGSRVFEAVEKAGGALAEADLDAVNLARPVSDGERIYVPRPGETVPVLNDPVLTGSPGGDGVGGSGATTGLIDINRADAASLQGLPGVGPVLAERIVAYRTEHGPFASVDALLGVSGIGPSILAKLAASASAG